MDTVTWVPARWQGRPRSALRLSALLEDHCVFRFLWPNEAEVTDQVYRSGQPLPHQLARWKRRGIRTVVNLRGATRFGSYVMERQACERLGLALIDFPVDSRSVPDRERLHRLARLFDEIAYPVLFHCKSGADRAGLVAALYLLFRKERPVEEAMRQLSWRYGHVKAAKTGMLDHFLELYRAARASTPIGFLDWVETAYDPVAAKRSFKERHSLGFLVERILRRE